jgi:2,3-bisphosphoglycerate-dependent phosphoglycerate mutase
MGKFILLCHGESVWNKKNIFTGWVDVALSSNGISEALKAGEQVAEIEFDVVFTSLQVRIIRINYKIKSINLERGIVI